MDRSPRQVFDNPVTGEHVVLLTDPREHPEDAEPDPEALAQLTEAGRLRPFEGEIESGGKGEER